jgi:hypothetical protein
VGALPVIWIVTNALGWSFPALVPIVTAAAGLLGYQQIPNLPQSSRLRGRLNPRLANLRMIEIPIDRTEVISERLGREQELIFQKEDLLLVFRRDERGRFSIRLIGPKKMTQRITEELERRGISIAEVRVNERGEQEIISRKW